MEDGRDDSDEALALVPASPRGTAEGGALRRYQGRCGAHRRGGEEGTPELHHPGAFCGNLPLASKRVSFGRRGPRRL